MATMTVEQLVDRLLDQRGAKCGMRLVAETSTRLNKTVADPVTGKTVAQQTVDAGLAVGVIGPYNSSVGVKTLPLYEAAGLVPVRFTTADTTGGLGVTVQPMTSQIAPVATRALRQWLGATKVALVYDSSETYTGGANAAMKAPYESRCRRSHQAWGSERRAQVLTSTTRRS